MQFNDNRGWMGFVNEFFRKKLFKDKRFLIILALVNFAAGFYSISYYLPQLSQTNPWFWLFVPDCPVYALLFGLNILLLVLEKPSELLSFVSIIGNLKYGLWTIFVFFLSGTMGLYWLFILSHALLIIETIVLAGLFSFKVKHVLVALVWFALNDYFDYVLGLHPFVQGDLVIQAGLFAIISSLLLPFIVSILFSAKSSNAPIRKEIVGGRWAKRI
jgi:uncharacterized membrane protein YpjA